MTERALEGQVSLTDAGLPPWIVALGLALPWTPPGGKGALIPDDVLLLLLSVGIGWVAWRATPRLDLTALRRAAAIGFGAAIWVKRGTPDGIGPALFLVVGAVGYGLAFPWLARRLFGREAPRSG